MRALGLPVFVKPARLGLVGGDRAGRRRRRAGGRARSRRSSTTTLAIVEAAARGIEVECSVLGNGDPIASQPGEILLGAGESGWYDYEAKYTPGGMELVVPGADPRRTSESGCARWR